MLAAEGVAAGGCDWARSAEAGMAPMMAPMTATMSSAAVRRGVNIDQVRNNVKPIGLKMPRCSGALTEAGRYRTT
jgi:hypothetical protein